MNCPHCAVITCTGYVRRVTRDEIADAVCSVFRHHHPGFLHLVTKQPISEG